MSWTDPRTLGATGDGETDDTRAIQSAIDLEAASAGPGARRVVRLLPGVYVTSTLRLRSHVLLQLDAGAVLRAHPEPDRYTGCRQQGKMKARWFHAMVLAEDTVDAGVIGPGTIDGAKLFDPVGEEKMRGPHTVLAANSEGFSIRHIDIIDSANYAVMVVNCDRTEVHGVTVTGGWDGVHARGNPERSCEGLTVTDCRFFTGDDAIAGCWVDDLLVHNCVLNSSCNGLRWIGPARRMVVDQCLISGPGRQPHRTQSRHNTLIGVTLQPSAWEPMPGDLDDIRISNLTMHRVMCPLMVVAHPPNRIGRIDIRRVTATGVYGPACSFESWAEPPIDHVTLSDLEIDFDPDGPDHSHAVRAVSDQPITRPHVGSRPLPAWGLYAHRVSRMDLRGCRFHHTAPGDPSAIRCDGVERLEHRGVLVNSAPVKTDDIEQRRVDGRPAASG